MTTFRALRWAASFVVATVGLATTAAAQTNDEIFPNLQWNFSTPGARANGMGRTFIGVADDATAAVTNPAGLVNLTRPQVYLEYKNTTLKVDRLAALDSLVTLQPTTFESTVNALSFVSVSAPINDKIAVGFSIHRFLDHHETFILQPRRIPNSPGNFAFFPVVGSDDFTGTSFGGSIAFRVTEALRVGLTIAGNRLAADSTATRKDFSLASTGALVTNDITVNQTSIHDTRNAIAASIGALYKVNEMLNLGFDYERSPRFNTTENLQINSGYNPDLPLSQMTNQPLATAPGFPKNVAINVPDHFGFGASIRPTSRLLIAADAVRMRYSTLSKNTTLIFDSTLTGGEYVTPDVTEVHVGAEFNVFSIRQKNPVFIRGGVYTNPNHLVTFSGTTDPEINADERAKYNLLPRKDETVGTAGAGFVIGSHFQLDLAYVFGKEFVASTAVRF